MAIPTYDQWIWPLLRLLASRPEGVRTFEAYEALSAEMRLTDAECAELLPSGRQPVFQNRIGWAQDRLKRHGLTLRPTTTRGLWKITEAGKLYVAAHPSGPSREELQVLAHEPEQLAISANEASIVAQSSGMPALAVESHEERIDHAVRELNESLAAELLSRICEASPAFFERLVLDVLSEMGYGADRSALQTTGGPGDGGIDGVIALDRLGLEKVAVQAKRWKEGSKVTRPDVQAFCGALAGHRVRKGVFITTSSFTEEAVKYAAQLPDPIVRVDGKTLSALMIEHGVGVTAHRIVKLAKIDSDYFEE